ncbi:MAG: hypothetical protein ACJ76F_14160 [Bacteroidia bacterium]
MLFFPCGIKISRFLFMLLLLAGFEIHSQTADSFSSYSRNHTLNETARELNDTMGRNYKNWMNTKPARKSVILFCDSVIGESVELINDYNSFKNLDTETPDSTEAKLIRKYNWYFSQEDTVKTLIAKDSAARYKSFKQVGYSNIMNFYQPLVSFLRLDRYELDDREIEMDLSLVRFHQTLQHLYNNYEYAINNEELEIPEAMQTRNKQLIAQRFEVVEKKNFVLYQSYSAKNSAVKLVDFFMDNDFFLLNGHNQDREYTGGGALTVSTDYFKWRWFNLGWLWGQDVFKNKSDSVIISKDQVLSYQSLKLGMHFFTPYIRYRNNFALADTLFQQDRPFGSYVYVERAKYRLWPKGLFRHQGNFQVGRIGTNAGRDIQALLHKDAITTSQKVYGWQNQVANGGRWLVQLNHKLDVLLFSTTNKHYSVFLPKRMHHDKRKYMGLTMYSSSELFLGGYYTALGTGLYFSLLDFTKQSGQNQIAARKRNVYEFGMNIETGFRYRYVLHNSMLEGVGYTGTFTKDPYDDEAGSSYTIPENRINRNIFIWETKLNFRLRKMLVYYGFTVQSKEYYTDPIDYAGVSSLVIPADQDYYSATVIKELRDFNKLSTYGYGRLGIVWVVE